MDEAEEQLPGQTHYLPHQAIIRSDALMTKLRVVFDARAKVKPSCPSLNDCTYTGPPLTPGITDILMRFRAHKVGLVVNIEKAFLNIAVDKQQRDLMRFLWIDDVTKDDQKCRDLSLLLSHLWYELFSVPAQRDTTTPCY